VICCANRASRLRCRHAFQENVWRRIEDAEAPVESGSWLDAFAALVLLPRFAYATVKAPWCWRAFCWGRTKVRTPPVKMSQRALRRLGRPEFAALSMNRSLLILLGALALAWRFLPALYIGQSACMRGDDESSMDDLSWLLPTNFI